MTKAERSITTSLLVWRVLREQMFCMIETMIFLWSHFCVCMNCFELFRTVFEWTWTVFFSAFYMKYLLKFVTHAKLSNKAHAIQVVLPVVDVACLKRREHECSSRKRGRSLRVSAFCHRREGFFVAMFWNQHGFFRKQGVGLVTLDIMTNSRGVRWGGTSFGISLCRNFCSFTKALKFCGNKPGTWTCCLNSLIAVSWFIL